MPSVPIENIVGNLLRLRGLRLAVAESCTGGLISHLVTNVPGSSTYFMGGVTAYAYEAKVRMLGVSWRTLEKYGAVSQETVIEMASGVRKALAADIGISVSGIAGPGGGTPDKPVGLTWIGLSTEGGDEAYSYIWEGDRLAVKEKSARQALRLLKEYLESLDWTRLKFGAVWAFRQAGPDRISLAGANFLCASHRAALERHPGTAHIGASRRSAGLRAAFSNRWRAVVVGPPAGFPSCSVIPTEKSSTPPKQFVQAGCFYIKAR